MGWLRKQAAKARKLAQLEWRDLLLLTEAWLTLAWVDLVISFAPYQRWRGWLQLEAAEPAQADPANQGLESESTTERVKRIIRLSEAASRHHLRTMNCLRRTLAQQRLLRRRQLASSVHIGVRKTKNALEAHAWLSQQGRVVNDAADVGERYAELKTGQWGSISRFV